jgi:hypothetical protein
VHASVDLQYQVGRVTSIDGARLTVDWEQALWVQERKAAPVIIAQLDAGSMRIMGTAEDIAPA